VTIYLVRHAKAGERGPWPHDDEYRPLSARGQRQALGLVDVLRDASYERLLSSPYVRCVQSLAPLAYARRLAIEPVDGLAEGATLEEALTLVRKHVQHGAVMCSHGDVIPMLLEHFARHGVDLGPDPQCPKGCTWTLEADSAGEIRTASYQPPPPDHL
jgi:8-oxo-dGTP diphosphatase